MKKMLKMIKHFFCGIWHFIDIKIIIPITKIILKLFKQFNGSGRRFEKWISKTRTLLFVSLFLAVSLFILVDQKILDFTNNSAEVLKDQPINVIYNDEAYAVEGLPKKVDITLIGSRADLYFAKQSSTHDIAIDLTGLKPGTHKVNIKYNQALKSIKYEVNPSVATVIIYPKISKTRSLTSDIINQDMLDEKLIIESVKLDSDNVTIKGAEHRLTEVSTVKALVDVESLPKQETGEIILKDVPLKAYDKQGNITNIEIVPSKVSAKIVIASPSKELPIKVIPKGDVAFGKAISSIATSETKVKVYGTKKALEEINYIPLEIDVSDLKGNYTYKLELLRPTGIRSMSVNNVTVDISLGTVSSKDIDNVGIKYRNIADDRYSIQGMSAEDVKVSVSLKGVKEVIDNITTDDVTAYLNLDGYIEGEHEVIVKVEGSDSRVQYIPKTKKVKIRISKK
ncbi:MAG: CdaR family protein [Bacilli bacterium]